MNFQRIHKLVFHPQAADFAMTSWDRLVAGLRSEEFLDKPFAADNGRCFLIGERFLQFITFMGCSPSVELTPPPNGSLDFCHICFNDIYDRPHFRCASQNVFARCPQCRKRMANWEHAIFQWRADSTAVNFQCDKCSSQVSIFQVTWRNTAGFARMFMDVYSIYPQEGIPTDQLLSVLEKHTGTPWNYFFTDQ